MAVNEFSGDEITTLSDYQYLLKIRNIQAKLHSSLAELREKQRTGWNLHFPQIASGTGKISRGTNYRSLPYLILDFPNIFSRSEVLACRTMIWWGHEISCTLHLQGSALEQNRHMLLKNLGKFQEKDVYICIHKSPWEYHFGPDNYLLSDSIPIEQLKKIVEEKDFIKISRKIPISEINQLPDFAMESFQLFTGLLLPA